MAVNINDLNEKWVNLGQKVSDLQNKAQLMVDDDATSAEDVADIKTKITNAIAKRDLAHENLVQAQAENIVDDDVKTIVKLTPKENDLKKKFVDNFKGMIKGVPTVVNQINSSTDSGGNAIGLTIPQDIQTVINTLKRQFDSLEQYVTVESVSTLSGSRNYEKWSDITPLAELEEGGTIADNDEPKLTLVKYLIKTYGGKNTITNSLLNDTAENLLAWLTNWIAKKVVATRNAKIIAQLDTVKSKPTLAKFDDIKDVAISGVDPAIRATSIFMTNTSGLLVLAKVKDAMGNYLLQKDPTNPLIQRIEGHQIVEVADRSLPDVSGSHPLYFGDFKEAIVLYDREHTSLLSTNIGGGAFDTNTTKIRVIDRFDVQTKDNEAVAAGSFKAIADQTANFTAGK
ncbi:MAG: phage major capsid protein [Leuconostoc mesenteroides]